jgi:putative addiction module CopG family antidote
MTDNINISVSKEVADFIKSQLALGYYSSENEFIEDALFSSNKLNWLRREIQEGIDSGNAGIFNAQDIRNKALQKLKSMSS